MRAVTATLLLLATTGVAVAQDSTVNVGNDILTPEVREVITIAIGAVITGIMGWLAALFQRRTGMAISQGHMNTLQTALTNAAGKVVARVGARLDRVEVDVRSPLLADAIEYVAGAAPDALAYFGLSRDNIAEKIIAKVGVLTAPQTNTAPRGTDPVDNPNGLL